MGLLFTGQIKGDAFVPSPAPALQLRPGLPSPSLGYPSKESTQDVINPQEMTSWSTPRLTDRMLGNKRLRSTWGEWI